MLLTMTQGNELHCKMDNANGCNLYHTEAIHSGHFMVSDIDDSEVQDDDDSVSVPVPDLVEEAVQVVHVPSPQAPLAGPSDLPEHLALVCPGYDFEGASKETRNTYKFGYRSSKSVSIDATLSKLFNCMTLAYSCKLTSPRWKNFKGLKLRWKDKIRLNNVIWRAWHMQFIKRQSTRICQFQSPLESEAHTKPEAVVLEGKYWKRQTQTVRAEYKSWRLFKQKLQAYKDAVFRRSMDWDSTESLFDWQPMSNQSAYSTSMVVDDDPFSDINDTLFSCLLPNQPIVFPNARELAKVGIADLIQPSLIPFQPNLDDGMDTLDWFSDIFSSRLPSVVEEQENFLSDFLCGPSTSTSSNTLQNNSEFPDLNAITAMRQEPNLNSQLNIAQQIEIKQSVAVSAPSSIINSCSSSQFNNELNMTEFQPNLTNSNLSPMRIGCPVQAKHSGHGGNSYGMRQNSRSADRSSVKMEQRTRNAPVRQRIYQHPNNSSSDCLYTVANQVQQHQHQIQPLMQQRSPLSQSSHNLSSDLQSAQPTVLPLQQPCSSVTSNNLTGFISSQYQDFSNSGKTYGEVLHNSSLKPATASKPPDGMCHGYNVPSTISNILPGTLQMAKPSTVVSGENVILLRRLSGELDKNNVRHKKEDVFALPKPKGRSRSRSGPNLGQMPVVAAQPSNANSKRSQLSSSSSVLYSTASNAQHPISIAPAPIITTVPSTSSTILPQNALLASLLAVGRYPTAEKQSSNKSSPTTVTILPTPVNQSTVVMTPVSLATVSSVNDLQSRVLVGATSHIFGGMIPPGKVPISPISSTTINANSSNFNFSSFKGGDIKHSPSSPPKPFRPKSDNDRVKYKEHRRVCHINAEQRRRCSIKNGFDTLHHIVPSLSQNPNSKISKAAMLQKAGEYMKQLKTERVQLQEETSMLKKQIENLNEAINMCQAQLPATGAPVPCQRPNKMQKMFDEYVRERTLQNWKFWIFSILIKPLLESYNNTVSTASMEDLCKTVLTWLEQHCSLVSLRPVVFNSLRRLSTTTNILTDPKQIQEEANKAVGGQT